MEPDPNGTTLSAALVSGTVSEASKRGEEERLKLLNKAHGANKHEG